MKIYIKTDITQRTTSSIIRTYRSSSAVVALMSLVITLGTQIPGVVLASEVLSTEDHQQNEKWSIGAGITLGN